MTEPLLSFRAAACVQGGKRILDHIDLSIGPSDRIAVVGANGTGKSTLVRLAAGLIPPAQGEARLFGVDLAHAAAGTLRRLRGRIGLALQGGSLMTDLSVEENLVMGLGPARGEDERQRILIDRALIDFGLGTASERRLDDLSSGEQRRLELARALIRDPDLLILDEPFEGVDAETAADLERRLSLALSRRPRAMLFTTYDEAAARRLTPNVYYLRRGALGPA